jgi:hypothetical protein
MRSIWIVTALTMTPIAALAQTTFKDVESYCTAMSEASTPTLLARTQGIGKEQSIAMMQGMTDPKSIRMVREVIEFAYSRPQSMPLASMRSELKQLCVSRKIFAQ